jgi:hypothetical protein
LQWAKSRGKGYKGGNAPKVDAEKTPLADLKLAAQKDLTEFQRLFLDAKAEAGMVITDFIESAFQAMSSGNWSDFGKSLLAGFASFLSTFGKQLVALAMGQAAFMQALANPTAWPVALAAGLAMIAAAGLIKGTLAGASQSFSSGSSSGAGAGNYSASNTQLKVIVEGKISGRDIVIVGRRYSDQLNSNT